MTAHNAKHVVVALFQVRVLRRACGMLAQELRVGIAQVRQLTLLTSVRLLELVELVAKFALAVCINLLAKGRNLIRRTACTSGSTKTSSTETSTGSGTGSGTSSGPGSIVIGTGGAI